MSSVNPNRRNDDRYVVELTDESSGDPVELDLRDLPTSRLRRVRDHAWQNADRDLAGRVDEILTSRNA